MSNNYKTDLESELKDVLEFSTPKTLIDAVVVGITNARAGRGIDLAAADIRSHIKDYLAQKFSRAFLRAKTPEESKILRDLWSQIINEDE